MYRKALTLLVWFSAALSVSFGQQETIPTGSFIVNMGVTPQTIANGMKPYGMVYDLIKAHGVPVKWVISQTKLKDGIDFTHNGIDYKGGTFIIPAPYRTSVVNARIAYWQGQGVVGATSVSPFSAHVAQTITFAPVWTLDAQNGSIAAGYFSNAGITQLYPNAYNWLLPAQLNCCNDIFVMPHADPKWATHSNLLPWNDVCLGGIWLACHAGSALEDMINPANPSQQANFLANKNEVATGTGPYYENALILWGNHSAGTPPYDYAYPNDQVMQFMGILDAATQNGSEQIYIPDNAGWRTSTKIGVWDPNHPQVPVPYSPGPAAIIAYGQGFGDSGRGKVMMEAGHSHNKSSAPANVAAQRAFFNFSFWAAQDKAFFVTINGLPSELQGSTSYPVSVSVSADYPPQGPLVYQWSSTCGGTFADPNAQSTTFTTPLVSGTTPCVVQCKVTDACQRETIGGNSVTIICDLQVTTTFVNPCFDSPNGGSIGVTVSNGNGPYAWSWSRTEGGSGSGSAASSPFNITGLAAGSYSVTVAANNGAGCSKSFSVTLTQSPAIAIIITPTAVLCNGGATGGVTVAVSGGTPGYTYLWNDGPTTLNRSGLTAGNYTITVTDSKGCTASATAMVTQPATISIVPTVTNVSCFDFNNGQISLAVSGGTPGYTYLWNDGGTTNPRTGLAPGTYAVTVTDANNCAATYAGVSVTQPAAPLSLSATTIEVLCYGAPTGSIDLTPGGGTPDYTYAWSGPGGYNSTMEDISGLVAGIYTVTVTDANGCTAVLAQTIAQSTPIVVTAAPTQPTCPPDAQQNSSDGAIDITVSGGTPGYTYNWSTQDGSGLTPGAEDQSGLTAGTYSVTITDSQGCTTMTSVILNYLIPNPVQPVSIEH